jgi:hypothetical protein
MYVIHAISGQEHGSWVVNTCNDRETAYNIANELNKSISKLEMYIDSYWLCLTDDSLYELCESESELDRIKDLKKKIRNSSDDEYFCALDIPGRDWTELREKELTRLKSIHPRAIPSKYYSDVESLIDYNKTRYHVSNVLDDDCMSFWIR